MLVGGGPQQKVLALRKEPEIDVMQAVPVQQVVCENIYRAGASGLVRARVRRACIAGAGLVTGAGFACRAIKRPVGVNFPEGKRGCPLIVRTHSARREPQEWYERRFIVPELQEQAW